MGIPNKFQRGDAVTVKSFRGYFFVSHEANNEPGTFRVFPPDHDHAGCNDKNGHWFRDYQMQHYVPPEPFDWSKMISWILAGGLLCGMVWTMFKQVM